MSWQLLLSTTSGAASGHDAKNLIKMTFPYFPCSLSMVLYCLTWEYQDSSIHTRINTHHYCIEFTQGLPVIQPSLIMKCHLNQEKKTNLPNLLNIIHPRAVTWWYISGLVQDCSNSIANISMLHCCNSQLSITSIYGSLLNQQEVWSLRQVKLFFGQVKPCLC